MRLTWFRAAIVALVAVLVVGLTVWIMGSSAHRATAYFTNTTGLYEGDEVRILGVPVGTVDRITPDGPQIRVEFEYDSDQPVPADAKAAIVAPTLVTSRYVQLAPRYDGGPVLADGAVIPIERTAVPVEWDEVKDQLSRVTRDLGPTAADRDGPLARALRVGADTLRGQGANLNDTVAQLAGAVSTLSNGSDDIFGTVRNLEVFTSALSTSDRQIVEFGQRLESVSGTLARNRQQLGTAVTDLRDTVRTVRKFVEDNRGRLGTSVDRLDQVTAMVAARQDDLAKVLHSAPTPLVNLYNAYDPSTASLHGQAVVSNLKNPAMFVCSGIAAAGKLEPREAARTCAQQLGPLLNLLKTNYPPVGVSPLEREGRGVVPASPRENIQPDGQSNILPPLTGPGGIADQPAPQEGN